jgi:cytochrome b561
VTRPVAGGYSAAQISLHWLIVVLVFFQLIFGESMSTSFQGSLQATAVDPTDATLAMAHIWVGFAILALVVIRLVLRLRDGAPPPPRDESPALVLAAKATHALFYILLFAVPVSGIVAYYWLPSAGEIHELGKPAFIILIVLHIAAALWHQFWLRDGLLMRMLKPGA